MCGAIGEPVPMPDVNQWLRDELTKRLKRVDEYVVTHIINDHGLDVEACRRDCDLDELIDKALEGV